MARHAFSPLLVAWLTDLTWLLSIAEGKHIAVLGGLMKSHHITVLPLIEGLLERGHRVSFLVPGTTEAKGYFPNGVGNATMVYLGKEDWSFDTLFSDQDIDMKNQAWHQKIVTFAKVLWSYREALEKPIFSMHDELAEWIQQPGIDAFILHMASFGNVALIENSGIPTVGFLAFPPVPFFMMGDKDEVCRYPNMIKPPRVQELKSSLVARVKNHMTCRFLQGYMNIADREIAALFHQKGAPVLRDGILGLVRGSPHSIVLGGPPLSQRVPLPPGMHLAGTVERPKPRPMPAELLAWLDAAKDAATPVMYISMGTKYALTEFTCAKLVELLRRMTGTLGIRVLWSLRASQQEELAALLPEQGVAIRIDKFTPQPEVLQHPGVKVFLSHCGWGGVTDTISVGVPVLAFPGMSEQFINARGLEDAGAAIMLAEDFSNLEASAKLLLEDGSYAAASKAAGETLRSYGGLVKALEIVESAANGVHLPPDPKLQAMMRDVDPFFTRPQVAEQWISCACFSTLFVLLLLVPCCCCRCLCKCCSRRAPAAAPAKKRQ